MQGRGFSRRYLAAILAIVLSLAPGLLSIVDAHPATRSTVVQLAPHVDAPGAQHPLPHPDRCELCVVASGSGPLPAAVSIPASTTGARRPQGLEQGDAVAAGPGQATRPRAPPIA